MRSPSRRSSPTGRLLPHRNARRARRLSIQALDEGCTDAHILHAELAARGVNVSKCSVRRFVHRMREHGAPTPRSLAPKAREVSALFLTHPDALPKPDQALLKGLTTRCTDLAVLRTLVAEFAEMLVYRQGDQ